MCFMFKIISHVFILTTTLTLSTLGITTQQEIEDWIQSLDQPVVKQNAYDCPCQIEFRSDFFPQIDTIETNRQEPQNNFLKYSREATSEECQLAGIDNLRIIDFDSIINGFDPELKAYAIKLFQNDIFLQEELDKWIQNREIFAGLLTKQDTTETGILEMFYIYKTSEEAANKYKKDLKQVFQELCRHETSKQVTILTLCIERISKTSLKFTIEFDSMLGFSAYDPSYNAIISGDSFLEPKKDSLWLYHELNHMIHNHLGLNGDPQFWETPDGNFEKNLFPLQNFPNNSEEEVEITKVMHFEIFGGTLIMDEKDEKIKIDVLQTLNFVQFKKNWNNPEETFNIIGFTKVDNNIYVNRLSDLDILKTARWGHCYRDFSTNISSRDEKNSFFKTLKEICTPKEILPPNTKYWDIWCKLHNRSNVEYICINTIEDCEKLSSSLDFKD